MSTKQITDQFSHSLEILQKFNKVENFEKIEKAGQIMASSIKNGGKIISCGNGGSMCDAMHFAEELTGRYRNDRKSIAAVSISDPSHITCVGNDYGFDFIFSSWLVLRADLDSFTVFSLRLNFSFGRRRLNTTANH